MFQHIRRDRPSCPLKLLALLGAIALTAACADDPNPGTGSGGTGGAGGSAGSGGSGGSAGGTDCTRRPDVDTYVANMAKKGTNNLMSFKIIESKPAPPAKTDNEFKVQVITDATGQPVTSGLKVRVWMPDHMHDSPTAPKIMFDAATSTYTINPVSTRLMPGVWQVRLRIVDANDDAIDIDYAPFNFCIP